MSGAGGPRQPPTAIRAAADGRQEAASGAEQSTAPQGFVSEQAKAVLPLGLSSDWLEGKGAHTAEQCGEDPRVRQE